MRFFFPPKLSDDDGDMGVRNVDILTTDVFESLQSIIAPPSAIGKVVQAIGQILPSPRSTQGMYRNAEIQRVV